MIAKDKRSFSSTKMPPRKQAVRARKPSLVANPLCIRDDVPQIVGHRKWSRAVTRIRRAYARPPYS